MVENFHEIFCAVTGVYEGEKAEECINSRAEQKILQILVDEKHQE